LIFAEDIAAAARKPMAGLIEANHFWLSKVSVARTFQGVAGGIVWARSAALVLFGAADPEAEPLPPNWTFVCPSGRQRVPDRLNRWQSSVLLKVRLQTNKYAKAALRSSARRPGKPARHFFCAYCIAARRNSPPMSANRVTRLAGLPRLTPACNQVF
jgi:hypothetical protein